MRHALPSVPRARAPRPLRWLGAALLFALVALPGVARADCAASGLTVLCQPPGTNGFDAGVTDGYTLTVRSGTTVNTGVGGLGLISLQNNNTVFNYGTINSATVGDAGVFAAANTAVTNAGLIS